MGEICGLLSVTLRTKVERVSLLAPFSIGQLMEERKLTLWPDSRGRSSGYSDLAPEDRSAPTLQSVTEIQTESKVSKRRKKTEDVKKSVPVIAIKVDVS